MSDNTSIEWTDASWTPLKARRKDTGKVGWHCERVSEGCKNCYAATFNHRMLPNGGTGLDFTKQAREKVDIFLDEKTLTQPLHWKRPRKVFVCSMTDLFAEFVPFELIDKVFAVMALTPQHTYQILTKRPERMAEYFATFDTDFHNGIAEIDGEDGGYRLGASAATLLDGDWIWNEGKRHRRKIEEFIADSHADPSGMSNDEEGGDDEYETKPVVWPLPNVILMTSVENQEQADKRIPWLLKCPAALRGLSVEPLLGAINLQLAGEECRVCSNRADSEGVIEHGRGCYSQSENGGGISYGEPRREIHWIIVGGESGAGARPMHPDWARSIRDQCQAAGVSYFFK